MDGRGSYAVKLGDTISEISSALGGAAARIERNSGVAAHQYCETIGQTDTIHTFFIVNGRVRHMRDRNYVHNAVGSCLTRLKPVVWEDWFNRN